LTHKAEALHVPLSRLNQKIKRLDIKITKITRVSGARVFTPMSENAQFSNARHINSRPPRELQLYPEVYAKSGA
jgi:hypothetical protein